MGPENGARKGLESRWAPYVLLDLGTVSKYRLFGSVIGAGEGLEPKLGFSVVVAHSEIEVPYGMLGSTVGLGKGLAV